MSKKIRLIRTIILEYTPIPEHYPECITIEEMAKIDIEGAIDDPQLTFEDNENTIKDEVKYEIVE